MWRVFAHPFSLLRLINLRERAPTTRPVAFPSPPLPSSRFFFSSLRSVVSLPQLAGAKKSAERDGQLGSPQEERMEFVLIISLPLLILIIIIAVVLCIVCR